MAALLTQIAGLLTQMLAWFTEILAWAIAEPLILFFLAISIIGMLFSWVRRLKGF